MIHLYSLYLQVQLHELGCDGYSKSYVFRGTKEITSKQLQVTQLACGLERFLLCIVCLVSHNLKSSNSY